MPNVPVPGMPLTGSGYVAPAPGYAPAPAPGYAPPGRGRRRR